MARWFAILLLALACGTVTAKEAAPASANPVLEARMMALASTFRCLVCQNETIADSQADLAADLRQQIRDMLAKGMTDAQVRDYMTTRYGDFVLYKPPFELRTAFLWGGPALMLAVALAALFVTLRRRQRASPDDFDPDTPDETEEQAGVAR